MNDQQFHRSVEERQEMLLKRAEKKYGPKAQEVGGHPDQDVLDYLINELAGLPRYAEMVAARVQEGSEDPNLLHRTLYITRRVSEEGRHLAFLVERLRHELIHIEGMELGKPENLGDDLHEE